MFVKIISNDKQLMTATGPGWWWSSLNHSEVKTARLAVWHGACCIKSILVSNVINHGCGHQRVSESSWRCLLDDSPLTAQPRHSHPCDDSSLFMLHITLCRSLSLTKLMMRCAWNVKIEQTFFHQKKEFFYRNTWSDLLMWSWCDQFTRLNECSHHLARDRDGELLERQRQWLIWRCWHPGWHIYISIRRLSDWLVFMYLKTSL